MRTWLLGLSSIPSLVRARCTFLLSLRKEFHHTVLLFPNMRPVVSQPLRQWKPTSASMRAWPRAFTIGRRGICLRFSPVPISITVWGPSSVREDTTNTSTWMLKPLLCISAAQSTRSVSASSWLCWSAITDGIFDVAPRRVIAVKGTLLNWISLSAR